MRAPASLAAAAVLLAPAPALADALQARVLAAARAAGADRYAFRRTTVLERSGQPRKTYLDDYDPRRPPDQRWQLVSVDGRAPSPKELSDSRKVKRGPTPSYAEVAKWFGGPATASPAGPGRVLYRFARLPDGGFRLGSHDASADTAAEALVNAAGRVPYVERVRFHSTSGFRMMLVAKVDSLTAAGRYRLLPDGSPVPDGGSSDMSGSLFGKSGSLRVTTSYADVRAVR